MNPEDRLRRRAELKIRHPANSAFVLQYEVPWVFLDMTARTRKCLRCKAVEAVKMPGIQADDQSFKLKHRYCKRRF